MNNNQNNQPPQNGGGNNFFNKNPIGAFIIFALVMIVIFKAISPSGGFSGSDMLSGGGETRNVSYSELKSQIENSKISMVSIGNTVIKAQSGGVTYVAKRVEDPDLVRILESKKIPYGAFSESNFLTDLLFSWILPFAIVIGIWMFFINRVQKNANSGILGI